MIRLFSSFDLSVLTSSTAIYLLLIANLLSMHRTVSLIRSPLRGSASVLIEFFFSLKPLRVRKFYILRALTFITLIAFINFFSVLPYNFPLTSQVRIVLFFRLSVWVCLRMFNLLSNVKGFVRHCVPEGTPIYLTWFLFAIELIRNSIRPLTLTVRLTANILAGHLLMILLSKLALGSLPIGVLYLLLNMVEIFVSLVQSYIFVTMITLYYRDVS